RVVRLEVQRFVYGWSGLLRQRILVKRPREGIPSVDVVANVKFFSRQFEGLRQIEIVVEVEDSQFAVINGLIEGVEAANVLDQIVLLPGFNRVSSLCINVAQGSGIRGQRNHADRFLVQLNRVC